MFRCTLVCMLFFLTYTTQVSDVLLTSNLTNGNIAYDEQVIVFRCIARGTILVWQSDDYIGSVADGQDLRLTFVDSPGHTEPSSLIPGSVASLVSVTDVNGGTVIESELQIRASLASRMSSVTCTNNGGGSMNTTTFRVVSRMVMLTSNLTGGNIAYDGQVIVFRCITRGTILVWQSDDYIGPIADGQDLRLTFVDSPGHTEPSSLVPGTVARVISIIDDSDGTLIESELEIRASLNLGNSSVTCTNNGLERTNTTYFRVIQMPTMTTTVASTTTTATMPITRMDIGTMTTIDDSSDGSTSTEESVPETGGSNGGVAAGVAVCLVILITSIVVVIIALVFFKCKRKHKGIFIIDESDDNKTESEREVQPAYEKEALGPGAPPALEVTWKCGSRQHENDPFNSEVPGSPVYKSNGDHGQLESPPGPMKQRKDFRVNEAKGIGPDSDIRPQDTPNDPGDIVPKESPKEDEKVYVQKGEQEMGDSEYLVNSESSVGIKGSYGYQEVEPQQDSGEFETYMYIPHLMQQSPTILEGQEEDMVMPIPATESGTDNAQFVVCREEGSTSFLEQSYVANHDSEVAYYSLPNIEQSYMKDEATEFISLPKTLHVNANTIAICISQHSNLCAKALNVMQQQNGSTIQQCEAECTSDSDLDSGASTNVLLESMNRSHLSSLQRDPNGGPFMISQNQLELDPDSDSRPTGIQQHRSLNILEEETGKQIGEHEDMKAKIEEGGCFPYKPVDEEQIIHEAVIQT